MTGETPLVSIGLPIYNAGLSLHTALDSLLAQTYTNFELIISDNASTDETWEICQDYAARDPRIKLYRNEKNQGATNNFIRVFELSSGEYFMWAAHDDSWDAAFVASCVEKLASSPQAVLCYTDQLFVNLETKQERVVSYHLAADSPLFSERASALLDHKPSPYAIIYGLYRREKVKLAFPFPRTVANDMFFLLKVARHGTFVAVPQVLYRRKDQAKEFHSRMKSVIPSYRKLPRPLVFASLMFRLWGFAWRWGESGGGKFRITLAATRFAGRKIVVYLLPDGTRKMLRGMAARSRLFSRLLKPLLGADD
jgi:glycosyltransferase involved in cell wall biosynthesis